MARLTIPVPRGRRGRSTLPGAPHPNPLDGVALGYHGVGNTAAPIETTAEKLAPGPKAERSTAPPPSHSGATSPSLNRPAADIPHETPISTVAYSPTEPGHSTEDFARAEAYKRRQTALSLLTPLAAPKIAAPLTIGQPGYLQQFSPLPGATPSSATLLAAVPQLHTEIAYPATNVAEDDLGQHPQHVGLVAGVTNPAERREGERTIRHTNALERVNEEDALIPLPKAPVAQPAASGAAAHFAALEKPNANPADPLGARTLGNVTQQQLVAAAQAGTLGHSKSGQITTPEGRQLLHGLLTAHKAADAARTLGPAKEHGQLTPEEIGTLLEEGSRQTHANLNPAELAEGIGVAEAETNGNASEQRQLAEFSDPEEAHIGLFAEEGSGKPGVGFGTVPERLNARDAAKSAIERFVDDERSWNPAWVHWQEIQGEEETGADRAPQYRALAKELVQGGNQVEPQAVKNLVDAQHAAKADGINPTPWNGDVTGGGKGFVTIRADAKGALNWAESAVGTQQGEPRQLHWAAITHGPEDPWCAEFIGASALRQGLSLPSDPAYAGSYLNWKDGKNIGTNLADVKPGDYLVFGAPGGEAEHIGMYKGDGTMVSGNFSNEVALSDVEEEISAAGGLQGIVRPKYKGGKIKVKAGSLPGSSSGAVPGNEGGYTGTSGAEAVPVSGSTGASGASGTAATEGTLPAFTALAGPQFGANSFEGQPGEAEELFNLLTQAASGSHRA